ncbi:MAG TPA: hypothetical protein VFS43_16800 [Polyangiaceae bacterium]|nr:hypothetical protein [Polyangiaceae bacterium]
MDITLSRAAIRRGLSVATALVAFAGLLVEALRPALGLRSRSGVVPLFSLSYEQNVPTWYASALLLSCALLLALIALGARRARAGYVRHWGLLAGGFLYISLDETVGIHEGASQFFHLGGVFFFGWVIPAGLLVVGLGLTFLRFLAHLPRPTRVEFLVAGAMYVGGAVLLELPLGYWTEREGSDNFVYAAIDWVEESMELVGVSLFLLSLLRYLDARGYRVRFVTGSAGGLAEARDVERPVPSAEPLGPSGSTP